MIKGKIQHLLLSFQIGCSSTWQSDFIYSSPIRVTTLYCPDVGNLERKHRQGVVKFGISFYWSKLSPVAVATLLKLSPSKSVNCIVVSRINKFWTKSVTEKATMQHFSYWVQQLLPAVCDDSMVPISQPKHTSILTFADCLVWEDSHVAKCRNATSSCTGPI